MLGSLVLGGALGLWLLSLALDPSAGSDPPSGPSLDHPLGVDGMGRDLLAALAHAQHSIFVGGFVACVTALTGGVTLGVLAGLAGGPIDLMVRYVCQVLDAFPRLVWLLLVATAFGCTLDLAIVALGIASIPDIAGEVRQRVRQLARSDFFVASHALGISWPRLVMHHVVRLHLSPSLARQAAFLFAYVLMAELALSYIGGWNGFLVIEAPDRPVRLGTLLLDARRLIDAETPFGARWWPLVLCSTFVVVLVGSLHAVGALPTRRAP